MNENVDVLKLLPSKTKPKHKITPKGNVSTNIKGNVSANIKGNTSLKQTSVLPSSPLPLPTSKSKNKNSIRNVKGKNKVSDEEKRRKKLFKEEMKAAKRRDAENKRIEKQIIEEEKRRKAIMDDRRKAIIANRMKQNNESTNVKGYDNESNCITTQMGSFKMKNVGNHNGNDEIELIPLGNGSIKFEISKPKSIISRRIDQYARRELDPSIVPIFNEMLKRKYLQMKINS